MTHDKDKILLRAKDISILLLVATVLGILGTQFKRVYRWDEAADRMEALEVRVSNTERTGAVVTTQLDGISKQLEQINWSLRRMQTHGRDS